MNLIDRIVGWFSPEAGAQREAWRQVLQEYRNYDAGSHGRANANWRAFNQSAEYTDRYSRLPYLDSAKRLCAEVA